jgi:hypothetical protein
VRRKMTTLLRAIQLTQPASMAWGFLL